MKKTHVTFWNTITYGINCHVSIVLLRYLENSDGNSLVSLCESTPQSPCVINKSS